MRGRFAPSPTGTFHLGNLRTALLAWLFARSAGSEFVLRFEDLDPAAIRAEAYDTQRRDLERLGLDWDSELCQRDHVDRYRQAIARLVADGLTYECFCTRREVREAAAAPHGNSPDGAYPGTCRTLAASAVATHRSAGRTPALRLKTSQERVTFLDRQLGAVSATLDDTVIARRDGTPAYNLVVVVDDSYQEIEEVVRGDDLASSTPRQLVLAEELGVTPPAFAHVPLVHGPTGERLAKRDGAVTLDDQNALGKSDADVLGVLAASLKLAPPGSTPSLTELVENFEPEHLPREAWQLGVDQLETDVGSDPAS